MKSGLRIIWLLTIVLSLATGMFKILQQEADILLFEKISMTATMTTVLGVIQFIGGIMLIPKRSRIIGAYIMTATFVLASIAVFANGMIGFGVVSLIFILMALAVIYMEKSKYNE